MAQDPVKELRHYARETERLIKLAKKAGYSTLMDWVYLKGGANPVAKNWNDFEEKGLGEEVGFVRAPYIEGWSQAQAKQFAKRLAPQVRGAWPLLSTPLREGLVDSFIVSLLISERSPIDPPHIRDLRAALMTLLETLLSE